MAKKKELSIPPSWDCCGPTSGSFYTHRQIKHSPFLEIAVKTHSPFSPYLADYFACVPPALKKGGCFICSWVKNESPVGPQQPQKGGIQSSFFLAN